MKKTLIGLISAVIVLVGILFVTYYFQTEEITCLRLYKEWGDPPDLLAIQLGEREAMYEHFKILVEYVERGCPEFHNMDTLYLTGKSYIENFEP